MLTICTIIMQICLTSPVNKMQKMFCTYSTFSRTFEILLLKNNKIIFIIIFDIDWRGQLDIKSNVWYLLMISVG